MLTGKDITVSFIFQYPTIAELARELESLPTSESEQTATQINSERAEQALRSLPQKM